MRQLLIEDMPDSKGLVHIKGKDARYLSQVLRISVDTIIDARLPTGELSSLRCIEVKKGLVTLLVQNSVASEQRQASLETGVRSTDLQKTGFGATPLWLFQCVGKAQRFDTIIRQATEIGVERIIPIISRYSPPEAKKASGRLDRWNRIIKEARQQSGSPINTTIVEPVSIENALELWKGVTATLQSKFLGFIFTEEPLATKSLYKYLVSNLDLVGAVVGPEGGFSQEELDSFKCADFNPIHFNINILRTETAALYSLANLQYAVMEFESWKASE